MRRLAAVFALLALMPGCDAVAPGADTATPAREAAADARVTVSVETAGGTHRFRAEIACTEAEQAQGLMHRTALAPDAAMLFPFPAPRIASFWMENTALPLDIIFVRADGTVARVAENMLPFSREPVTSLEPVTAALEIAGGRAAELGIAEGDRVSWPGSPDLNGAGPAG